MVGSRRSNQSGSSLQRELSEVVVAVAKLEGEDVSQVLGRGCHSVASQSLWQAVEEVELVVVAAVVGFVCKATNLVAVVVVIVAVAVVGAVVVVAVFVLVVVADL